MEEKDPKGLSPKDPGAKLDAGKTKAGLLKDFSLALDAAAQVATYGADKYSEGGWQYVENGSRRYEDAMWRHLLDLRHNKIDKDSGLPVLWHFLWNVLAIVELERRKELGIND